ncbi:hypothetical protein AB6A40_009398 [Gnathostoma spinigerum]|uniref:Major sperm protein n=1 Tax=Gnathostoma spinigerum TaxID=75299 RepID=A0ABD6EWZ8_9BILA
MTPDPNNPPPPRKPGEPTFQLKLEPLTLVFKNDNLTEGFTQVKFTITNTSNKRQTFKVKCTANEIFRTRPAFGYLQPQESTIIRVRFASKSVPESGKHYFSIYHMAAEEDKPLKELWSTGGKEPEGVQRMYCYFQNNDGTPAPLGESRKSVKV